MKFLDKFITKVSASRGVPRWDIIGRRRTKSVAAARVLLYRKLREHGLSYPEIGKLLNRNHTTILKTLRNAGYRDKTKEEIENEKFLKSMENQSSPVQTS